MLLLSLLLLTHVTEQDFSSFNRKILTCPTSMTTLLGATQVSDCVCQTGFYSFGDACAPCPSNTFKSTVGNSSCTPCPQNSKSVVGSVTQNQCLCDFGFEFANDACIQCESDKFKNFVGNSACLNCPQSSTSVPGSLSVNDCFCTPGFERTSTFTCNICSTGFYKGTTSHNSCTPCPQNFYSSSQGATICSACPKNSYTTSTASSSLYDCLCTPGFEFNNTHCNTCKPNFFCPGASVKSACPTHSVSLSGSTSTDHCSCLAGFYKTTESKLCEPCPPNTFCEFDTRNIPSQCPPNSSSPSRSTSENDCICLPGYQVNEY